MNISFVRISKSKKPITVFVFGFVFLLTFLSSDSFACVPPSCPEGSTLTQLDKADIGNSESEATHAISGWSAPNLPGNYGGCQQGSVCDYRQVIESPCTEEERSAFVTLHLGDNTATKLVVRHLDGISLLDSFDIYVGDILVAHFEDDTQVVSEVWRETEFNILPEYQHLLTGDVVLEIVATNNIWGQCPTYGQVSIDWINAQGCVPDEVEPLVIKAYKVVCDNESDLPNWTDGGAPSLIDENTAANYVSQSQGVCHLEADWDFQWGFSNVSKLSGDYVGPAPTGTGFNEWKNFDSSTGASEPAEVEITDLQTTSRIWVREVLKSGYIPFTNPPKGVAEDNVSAELYCHTDILNYDNYDYIISPVLGQTYYCIGFNTLEEIPGCTDPKATNYNENATEDDGSCEYETVCPEGSSWGQIDEVDIGNAESEATHAISGWSAPNLPGNYGGCQQGTICDYRQVIESPCTEEERSAFVTLHLGDNTATKLVVRHLDGISLLDSFDIYVGDILVAHFEDDTQVVSEVWRETEFDVSQYSGLFTGDVVLEIIAVDNIWAQCPTYGQVSIDWINVQGCVSDEEPTGSITVCKIIIDSEGNVVDGSEVSGAEFSIFDTVFTTPLTLNANLLGDDQINDAECVVYDLPIDEYFYSEEIYPGTGWKTPLYNDQYTMTVNDLEDLLPFNIDDDNVDGHIVLSGSRPNRTLVVLNQYGKLGCTDPEALNHDEEAVIDDGSCQYPPGDVYGCTNSEATNYNQYATIDDGSCEYDVYGCTDPEATNYNQEADIDDGSCEYPGPEEIFGCTDQEATNYNPDATIDDGFCEYEIIYGCTNPAALNYNSLAAKDNGSCEYSSNGGGGGPSIIALRIFNEGIGDHDNLSVTFIWQTNKPATSRIVYDTVPHPDLGTPPNYGYAYSTPEDPEKVLLHSVTITGLLPNTIYYWRPISKASPEVLGDELIFDTSEFTPEEPEPEPGPGPQPGPSPQPQPEPERQPAPEPEPEPEPEESEFTLDFSEPEEEEIETVGLLAAIGDLFTRDNLCWLIFALIIIVIALFILSKRRENPAKEKRRKWYFLILTIVLMIIYYFLCPFCLYCWIIILVLAAIAIISLFFRSKEEIE